MDKKARKPLHISIPNVSRQLSESQAFLKPPSALTGNGRKQRRRSAGDESPHFFVDKMNLSDMIEDGDIKNHFEGINSATDFELFFTTAIRENDGTMVREFLQHPEFHELSAKIKLDYFRKHWHKVRHNSILVDMLVHVLLRHVTAKDYGIQQLMTEAIQCDSSPGVLASCDRLLTASFKDMDTPMQTKLLMDIYQRVVPGQAELEPTDEKTVLQGNRMDTLIIDQIAITGVKRHIEQVFNCGTVNLKNLSQVARSRLMRLLLRRHLTVDDEVHLKNGMTQKDIADLHSWDKQRKFINTRISLDCESTKLSESDLVLAIESKMNIDTDEALAVKSAVHTFMLGLSEEVAKFDPNFKFIPILTGSACEGTKTYFPDEFDYVFLFHSDPEYRLHINNCLKALSKLPISRLKTLCKDSRLVVDGFLLTEKGKFPLILLTWMGEEYQDMDIHIDIVPSIFHDRPVRPSHHCYLPVIYSSESELEKSQEIQEIPLSNCPIASNVEQQDIRDKPDIHSSTGAQATADVQHHQQQTHVRWYTSVWYGENLGSSVIENEIMKALPENIQEGYRLAKAMRITHVIYPAIPRLIELGVTNDLHDILRTYSLKTCVLFLTEALVESEVNKIPPRAWAIRIYRKLRHFLLQGTIPQFFESKPKFNCDHVPGAKVKETQYRCCRDRQAKLAIVDRILELLEQ